MLTGKAAFDALATASATFLGVQFTYKGLAYVLTQCDSVTGPYFATCMVNGFYRQRQIVADGVDALVVRYSCAASGNRPKVDPTLDTRVLTSISVAEGLTNAQLGDIAKQFLEDAR